VVVTTTGTGGSEELGLANPGGRVLCKCRRSTPVGQMLDSRHEVTSTTIVEGLAGERKGMRWPSVSSFDVRGVLSVSPGEMALSETSEQRSSCK
jgi:hypothetical protein